MRLLVGAAALALAVSCGNFTTQPYKPERARLGPETPMKRTLKQLPPPKDKVVAAVYKFRDQTGQYKMSETGGSWSTAVTQGATTILIRALEESGWFMPIERENINNLLNERKIIRSSRAQFEGKETDLPPLLFAGVLLEGGIISYESNLLTGGIGVRYFGIGGSSQYRMDRVTIYLRAVSTSSGAVLKTVYTSKTILSQEVKANVYRYVSLTKLLEGETGFTYNEPSELCITEAIEKAVESLVIEGVKEKYWQLQNPKDSLNTAIVNYARESQINEDLDIFGNSQRYPQQVAGQLSIGAFAGAEQYNGDFAYSDYRPLFGICSDFTLSKCMSFGQSLSFRSAYIHKAFYNEFIDIAADLKFKMFPYHKGTPIAAIKLGACFATNSNKIKNFKNFYPYIGTELGFTYRVAPHFSVNLMGMYSYMLNDKIDGVNTGTQNDQFWGAKVGFFYHF